MKRALCVLLLLALTVPVLLIPASAAEEYVFEWINPEVMMLGDSYDFATAEGDTFFAYAGLVPEGTYTLSFQYWDAAEGLEIFVIDPLTLVYEDTVDGLCASCTVLVEVRHGDYVESGYFEVFVCQLGSNSLLVFREPGATENFSFGDVVSVVVLTPVVPVPSLSHVISSDFLDGVLNEIIVLFPVVLVVLISYISIRKGLAWIRDLLHGA